MQILRDVMSILLGFSSGLVTAGAVFAFITVIGVIPRLAQKTNTVASVKTYETAIMLGGIFGTLTGIFQFHLPIGTLPVVILSLSSGIFFGCLAMALAEVLNVIPILMRRGRIQRGMFYFVLAIAIGKTVGALLYFLVPGFFEH